MRTTNRRSNQAAIMCLALTALLGLSACEVGSEGPIEGPSSITELPADAPYGAEGWTDSGWLYGGPNCGSSGVFYSPCGFTFDGSSAFWAYQVEVSIDDCDCNGEDLGHGPCWAHGTRTYSWYVCGG